MLLYEDDLHVNQRFKLAIIKVFTRTMDHMNTRICEKDHL